MRLGIAVCLLAIGAFALGCGGDDDSSDAADDEGGGALTFASDDASGDGSFDQDGFPFTFSYPADFEETEDPGVAQQLGGEASESGAVALDDDNGILVQVFPLQRAVSKSAVGRAKKGIDALIAQADPTTSSRTDVIAGLPAVIVSDVDVPQIEGAESRFVFLFDGDQEYQLNCQFTPDGRAAVEEACDQAAETFELR